MTAIETVRYIMTQSGTSLQELTEYTDLGSKSNICQKLSRNDLKVSTFVEMLESMGYQLIAQNTEGEEEIVVDYDD